MDPDITNMLDPRTKWAIYGTNRKPAGQLQVPPLTTGKKVMRRKSMETSVTELVIKQVEEMAVKDGAVKGINFKDRKGVMNLTMTRSTRCW